MDSRRPSAASSRRSRPLPASAACASTDTIYRTNDPEGGMPTSSAGATPSWVIVASTGNEVNPAPAALVAKTVTRLSRSSGSGTTSDAVPPTSVRPRIGSTASVTKTSTRASAWALTPSVSGEARVDHAEWTPSVHFVQTYRIKGKSDRILADERSRQEACK
jgi:hypothetical protein